MAAKKANQKIYELTFCLRDTHTGTTEIVRQILLNSGIKSQDIIEYEKNNSSYLSIFFKQKRQTTAVIKQFQAIKIKGVRLIVKSLKPADWQNKWKEDFKPIPVAKSFIVIPVWNRKKYSKLKREPLYMDEAFAFGTGQHETTRFMVQLIEMCQNQFVSFFDIGTGTGILSLVAFKCGAKDVSILDMEENCIKAAKRNFKINGYKHRSAILMNIKSFTERKKYDFVAANLITHSLTRFKKKIFSYVKKGKFLAVSGIANENLPLIKREYRTLPLRCLKICKGKNWSALLYQRIG